MHYFKLKPFICTFTLAILLACGSNHPGPLHPSVKKTTPSSTPPFFQFRGPVGNSPQSPFNIHYQPRSRSIKAPKQTQESSGALLYTHVNGTQYILIGKENSNGFWNFMRGSVDAGDSYLKTAEKEILEETGGVYTVTQAVLQNESFDVFYRPASHNYACTFFVSIDYVPADQILHAARNHPNPNFREMNQYAWIRTTDLITALHNNTPSFSAGMASGGTQGFQFYLYSFNILRQAENHHRIISNLK